MTAAPIETTVEQLDEDWALPCEFQWIGPQLQHIDCTIDATWIARSVACCPDRKPVSLMCDRHRERFMAPNQRGNCLHCGRIFLPAATAFTCFEPLNRRGT